MATNPSTPKIIKQHTHFSPKAQQGSIISYLLVAMIILALIGSIASLVIQQSKITSRQTHLEKAYQFADGGASIATFDLNSAFTLNSNAIEVGLKGVVGDPEDPSSIPIPAYTLDNTLSTADEHCYVRTIEAPFTNQEVYAQIWLKKEDYEGTARVVAKATSGGVTQSVTAHIMASYAFGAAIISTAPGNGSTNSNKNSGMSGELVVPGNSDTNFIGPTLSNGNKIIDGGGQADDDDGSLDQLYGTEDEIPNYTDAGSLNQLFDFERFIAVGDEMGTRYTVEQFQKAMKKAYENGPGYLEGIIVVDIGISDDSITSYSDL